MASSWTWVCGRVEVDMQLAPLAKPGQVRALPSGSRKRRRASRSRLDAGAAEDRIARNIDAHGSHCDTGLALIESILVAVVVGIQYLGAREQLVTIRIHQLDRLAHQGDFAGIPLAIRVDIVPDKALDAGMRGRRGW
jgi:hypothetical protein